MLHPSVPDRGGRTLITRLVYSLTALVYFAAHARSVVAVLFSNHSEFDGATEVAYFFEFVFFEAYVGYLRQIVGIGVGAHLLWVAWARRGVAQPRALFLAVLTLMVFLPDLVMLGAVAIMSFVTMDICSPYEFMLGVARARATPAQLVTCTTTCTLIGTKVVLTVLVGWFEWQRRQELRGLDG